MTTHTSTSTEPDAPLAQEGVVVKGHRWTPNRIVALGTGAVGILIALASLATASGGPQAAGVAAGVVALVVPAREWLIGWREYERRQGEGDEAVSMADAREVLERAIERERAKAERPA